MNKQHKPYTEERNIEPIQITASQNDVSVEVRKKSVDEPFYVAHL